jgi:hypothetical protein
MDVEKELKSTLKAKQIYERSSQIALKQGTRIFNANPRNYLDAVPRVTLSSLFAASESQKSNDGTKLVGNNAGTIGAPMSAAKGPIL